MSTSTPATHAPATRSLRPVRRIAALALGAALVSACASDATTPRTSVTDTTDQPVIDPRDGGAYDPTVDPAAFTDVVDNPYFPLQPGARWEYDSTGTDEPEHTTVVVTGDRKQVMGVSTVVVRDTVTVGGEVVEDTFDWYAQDREGNVWYFGEAVQNFVDGRLENTDGSFEAGVDGALPGIVMPADPIPGHAYRQEYFPGEAEDLGEILRDDEHETVPAGDFEHVVVTRDWNPLEPDVVEEKSYAPGVGLVAETTVAGGTGTSQLVSFSAGGT